MRTLIVPAAVFTVALMTCTVVTAETIRLTQPNTGSNAVVVKDTAAPLAAYSVTQSTDPYTIVDGTSVQCVSGVSTENGWWRLFNLDDDHGLVGDFCVEDVDWATRLVVGSLNLTVNVYCLDEGLPFMMQFLTLQDSAVVPVADEEFAFHNTAVGGCCDTATQDMAVELFAEDCQLVGCDMCIIGMNDLGQTGPTYHRSVSCGIVEPLDLASIGFPNAHLIMVVNGQDEMPPDDGGDPDVPATTSVGVVLLLFILFGGSAYFLRRRANRTQES